MVKQIFKSKKPVAAGLSALALLVSVGTVAGLLKLGASAVDLGEQSDTEASDVDLTIELGDEPVFAFIKSIKTVDEVMPSGYTLKAYSENPTLSSEGTDKTISLVTIPEDGLENAGSLTTALTDNTWGLAVEEPESEEQEIYFSLPETAEEAVTIATVEDMEAEDSDTVTVYYGIYVTPDMPYGTYTGASVNYILEDNSLATVIFDGNELYFNGDSSQTTNTAKYAIEISDNSEKYSHTPNIADDGSQGGNVGYKGADVINQVITIPGAASVKVELTYGGGLIYGSYEGGWASMWQGSHSGYTAQNDYGNDDSIKNCGGGDVTNGKYVGGDTNTTVECEIAGDSVTFAYYSQGGGPGSGPTYGYYAVVTGYDADGNVIYLPENQRVSGEYLIPGSDSYYRFLGWDTDKTATSPAYASEEDIAKQLALTPGADTTLYAIWEPAFTISYNGNGADTTTNMDSVEQYTTDIESESKSVDLLASNFTRDGYGFVGWSEDEDAWDKLVDNDDSNNPTIYGPNQTITVDPSTSTKLALYAVWAPAEQVNGEPVTLQNWTGCPNLATTTYNDGVLTVSKNTITALTDARDDKVYAVAKLADGNCWMIENLKLDDEPELSQNNTDNPSLPLTNNYEEQITSNKLSASSNTWCNNWSTTEEQIACYDHSNLNTNNTALAATSPVFSQDFTNEAHQWSTGSLNLNIASYGNYYNWYSATAGNGTYSTGYDEEQGTNVYEDTLGDVCPTGWHLPYGGSGEGGEGQSKGNTSGGFYYLNQQMGGSTSSTGSNNWRSFPNNFVYSGNWNGSSANYRGDYGSYWSSTANGTNGAYRLNLSSSNVSPDNYNNKSYGFSVRCVAPVE